jgi:hypothetical protein
MSDTDPDADELLRLHELLIAEIDPTAPACMAELLLPALKRRFAGARLPDPHDVESLIGWSIARYVAEPTRWQPQQAPLLAFLYQDVNGDIVNERDRRARLRRHEEPDSAVVELVGADRNPGPEEEVLDDMDPFDMAPAVLARAREEIAPMDSQDRQLIELLGDGVRATSAYAEVLGIVHLPKEAQADEVKRHKDRLKKRLGVIRAQLDRTD